jgi:polysaccharide transporter, PST family
MVWLVVSEAVGKLALVIANILLARRLNSQGYGTFALAQTWVLYAVLAVDFGFGMYGQREAAKQVTTEKLATLVDDIFTLKLFLGIVTFLLFSILCWLLVRERLAFLSAMTCGLYLLGYAANLEWLFRGRERYGYVFVANVVASTLFLVLIVIAVSGPSRAPVAGLLWSGSCILPALLYVWWVPRLIGRSARLLFHPARWQFHLRDSGVFSLSGIFMQSYQYMPLLILGWFVSEKAVGLFAAPYRIITQMGSLAFLLPMAFYPIMAQLKADHCELFHQSRRLLLSVMIAGGFPLALAGTMLAGPLTTAVFGHDFAAGAPLFRILIWLVPLYCIRYVYGSTLLSTGFQRLHLRAAMTGAATALVLGLAGVLYLGSVGIAMSTLIAECVIIAGFGYCSLQVHGGLSIPAFSEIARLLLLNFIIGAAAFWVNAHSGWLLSLVLFVVAYPLGLWTLHLGGIRLISQLFLRSVPAHAGNQG